MHNIIVVVQTINTYLIGTLKSLSVFLFYIIIRRCAMGNRGKVIKSLGNGRYTLVHIDDVNKTIN